MSEYRESTELGQDSKRRSPNTPHGIAARPNAAATAICGKVEARTCGNDRCRRRGISRKLRTHRERPSSPDSHDVSLMGLISFSPREKTSAARAVPAKSRAQERLALFTRIWRNTSFAPRHSLGSVAGSGIRGANARAKGTLRIEGKD